MEHTLDAAPESSVRDYISLLKPGVMSLVVFSGAAGMWMAPDSIHPFIQLIVIVSIAAGSGAGGAINMWFDRDIDALMLRTLNRPVPAKRIHSHNALGFGMILGLFSVMTLGLATNWVAASMLGFAIFFYAVIYTMWLKRLTPQNIVIGGAAGAFPPVIGWLAANGNFFALLPWALFLVIFLWTPPHFWALALYRSSDYKRANIPMMPVVAGLPATKRLMIKYSVLLLVISLVPFATGDLGKIYGVSAAVLGGIFVFLTYKVSMSETDAPAKKLFAYSILYLFVLLAMMLTDHWSFL
jgi:heme o synthase